MPVWQTLAYRPGEELFPEDGRTVDLSPLNSHEYMSWIETTIFRLPPRQRPSPNHHKDQSWFDKILGWSPFVNHHGISVDHYDQMVFRDKSQTRYYVDSWGLCNCPRVPGKPVGQTCQDQEGTRECQPGKSLHDKARNCILKIHPDVILVDGASIHDGNLDLKSMTINVEDANGLMLRSKFRELQAQVMDDYDRALAL